MTDSSTPPAPTEPRWPRLYAFVMGGLLLEMALFYAMMRYFS